MSDDLDLCLSYRDGWRCTLPAGHDGDHEALGLISGHLYVYAVWPDVSALDIADRLTATIADYDPDVSSTDDLITLLQDARSEITRLRAELARSVPKVETL